MAKENIYGNWSPDVVKKFKSWQLRTILVSMIGYAIYYFVRKNFSIAMPGLTAQYGISNTSYKRRAGKILKQPKRPKSKRKARLLKNCEKRNEISRDREPERPVR